MERSRNIVGIAIGDQFAPWYAGIFMDQIETEFFEAKRHMPFVWFCSIVDVIFTWIHDKEKLSPFLENLSMFYLNIKFTHETINESIYFLCLKVRFSDGKISEDFNGKPTDSHQNFH